MPTRGGTRRRGCGVALQLGLLHEPPGLIDPGDVGHMPGRGTTATARARHRRRLEPGAARSRRYQQAAAGGVGHLGVASREPASATSTSRTIPAEAPGTSAAKRRQQRAFALMRGDDHAQHGMHPQLAPASEPCLPSLPGSSAAPLASHNPTLCSCFVRYAEIGIAPWLDLPQPSNARRRQSPPRRRAALRQAASLPPTDRRRPAAIDLAAPRDDEVAVADERRRGRGAQSNASGRYEPLARVAFDDGWQDFEELPPFKTSVTIDSTRKIITRNDSPDISFDRSINPYRGCEHGCIYCFARPTHAYLGLSPGLDFEIEAVRQAGGAEAARARAVGRELRAAHHRDRHQHRSLPADRARASGDAAHPRGARALTAIRSAS